MVETSTAVCVVKKIFTVNLQQMQGPIKITNTIKSGFITAYTSVPRVSLTLHHYARHDSFIIFHLLHFSAMG